MPEPHSSNLDFAAERADFERVLEAARSLQRASLDSLGSLDWLADIVRHAGLVPIPEYAYTYEGESEFINGSQQGLIQLPREFARWLLLLGEMRPSSYLEIGTFNGATATLAAAYLRRFVPDARVVTCDLFPHFIFQHAATAVVPLEYAVPRTSFDFRDQTFEAVFIDGDHSFEWAWADYLNAGQRARLCGIHDVQNAPYRDLHLGGVCGVWDRVIAEESNPHASHHVFSEHSSGRVMGLGVRRLATPSTSDGAL